MAASTSRSPSGGPGPAKTKELRALLETERARTQERIAGLSRDFEQIAEAVAIGSTDDEHDPEGATIAFERAQILALRDQAHAHLAELDRAEERLRDGGYGICEGCGQAIPVERLQARPTASRCVACA